MSEISTTMQNFIQIGLGVAVLRMRDFAPLGTKWLGYFWVLEKGYSRNARTDFDAKYVERRGSVQGISAFWGSRNQYLRFGPHSPQTAILGPISTGLRIFFSAENDFNIGRLESKRPLIVVGAQ